MGVLTGLTERLSVHMGLLMKMSEAVRKGEPTFEVDPADKEGLAVTEVGNRKGHNAPEPMIQRARDWLKSQGMRLLELGETADKCWGSFSSRRWEETTATHPIAKNVIFMAVLASEKSKAVKPDASTEEESEHDRLMRFFTGFDRRKAAPLPPPPRILGKTWDDLAD